MRIKYRLVVDTDSYAGNFERELTAFCTGCIGDCEVGREEAQEFLKPLKLDEGEEGPWEEYIGSEADEHGCYRPCVLEATPGRFNDGLGTEWDDDADWEQVRAKFAESCKKNKMPVEEPFKCPAYESVAVHLCKLPPQEMLNDFKARAAVFCEREKIKIKGFRLITENITEVEQTI